MERERDSGDYIGRARVRVRQERVLARITARVITPGSSGGRGVTFNRFDALHGPENEEAVDATRSACHKFTRICANSALSQHGFPWFWSPLKLSLK